METQTTKLVAHRYAKSLDNVWVEFSAMARDCEHAIDLGEGFPGYTPSAHIQKHLEKVNSEGNQFLQYTREQGHPRLCSAIAALYSPLFGRDIDSKTEIIATHGAYESLQCALLGLINPGDEVIMIEPYYDSYPSMTRSAEGIPVFVPLRPDSENPTSSKDWKLNYSELASKFSTKTKAIIFNNPSNPVGKVYTKEELLMISELCCKHDVLCISDEVYEWLVYPGCEHVRIATLPGMWERTITICSASKSFSVTGWRVGWSIGPKHLIDCVMIAHQNGCCNCNTPCQEAVARCIEDELDGKSNNFFQAQLNELHGKRDLFVDSLVRCGLVPCRPDAGYFVLANWSNYGVTPQQLENGKAESNDFKFAKWLIKEKKVVAIPPTAFCENNRDVVSNFIRFNFFKTNGVLAKAEENLKA